MKEVENIYFGNVITDKNIYGFEEQSRLFIRQGIEQLYKRSFFSSIMYLFYGNNDVSVNLNSFIKSIIKNVSLSDFLHLNNGNIARYYSPPITLIEKIITINTFKVFIELCNNPLHRDTIEMLYPAVKRKYFMDIPTEDVMKQYFKTINNNTDMTMLLRHFYGFQYYLKHIANHNLELPWRNIIHLLSKSFLWKQSKMNNNNPELFNNGVNIIIIESTTDLKHSQESKEQFKLLCPNKVDYSINYDIKKPTLIITKTNNIFEPVVLKVFNKIPAKATTVTTEEREIISIFDIFNNIKLEDVEKTKIAGLI